MLDRLRKRWVILSVSTVTLVILGLLLPTLVGSWAPVLHVDCAATGAPAVTLSAWIPVAAVNSPYGGVAFDNGTVPPGPLSEPPSAGNIYGTGASNGSANWAGFRATVNATPVENQTVWGPGTNVHCQEPFALSFRYQGGIALGLYILRPGNRTDREEPSTLNYTPYAGDVDVYLSNGFGTANTENISTCGGPAKWSSSMASSSLTIGFPIAVGSHNLIVPYNFPFTQVFRYSFPANFGTWQVDDLSAPGGPGGGWAFSYSPCT